jgi:hypothetical protein
LVFSRRPRCNAWRRLRSPYLPNRPPMIRPRSVYALNPKLPRILFHPRPENSHLIDDQRRPFSCNPQLRHQHHLRLDLQIQIQEASPVGSATISFSILTIV